ncbi:MAG: hypothetical protein HY040_16205 [Planctomycetes bacterium]|nr:hypothetical protein [Planctomycetota bacterium]
MLFEFHAEVVDCDNVANRLSFAESGTEQFGHYLVVDRAENPASEAAPDMEDVYIERDDQMWGGYGGIERLILTRDALTLYLGPRMTRIMGSFSEIRVRFSLNDNQFQTLHVVLGHILHGYESRLEYRI